MTGVTMAAGGSARAWFVNVPAMTSRAATILFEQNIMRSSHGGPHRPRLNGNGAPAQARFALSRPNALSDDPGTNLNATFARFQALMAMTSNVRSDSSFSENWPRTRS